MTLFNKLILVSISIIFYSFISSVFAFDDDLSKLEVIAGLPKPPFILEKNGQGLQLDLLREALAYSHKEVEFIHVPFGRNVTGFKRLNADAILTIPAEYEHPSLFVSKPYIVYQNVAVSLSDNQLSIKEMKDLLGKNIIAFQNAKKYLGDEYNNIAHYSMDYREIADQIKQIEMLFTRRTEVIVLDVNIFKYFVANQTHGRYAQPFTIHYIFNERLYSAGFKSEKVRDSFDEGIKAIKEQGIYQLIYDKYLIQR